MRIALRSPRWLPWISYFVSLKSTVHLPGTGEALGPCVSVNIWSSRCNLIEFNPGAEMPTAQLAAFNFVHNRIIVTTMAANSDRHLRAHRR